MKNINLDEPVASLIEKFPNLKNILKDLGFTEITNPLALSTVGKMVSIKKGAKIKNIDLDLIKEKLREEGFNLVDEEIVNYDAREDNERLKLLKSYIERLSEGEDLESVRSDFVKNFKDVSSKEIVAAEQELIMSGLPLEKVQKLCDIHSALFHESNIVDESQKDLENIPGHPLNILSAENKKIKFLADEVKNSKDKLAKIRELLKINSHYGKKAGLIYPLLKTKYNISGPSDVMWAVDDEIRSDLSNIVKTNSYDEEGLNKILDRVYEMIYKEENILFPLLKENFTEEEWNKIYGDLEEYGLDLLDDVPLWKDYKPKEILPEEEEEEEVSSGSLEFETGSLKIKEALQIFRTLDAELTFIDKDDFVRYYSEGKDKIFPRPKSCLNRDVASCHPPKVVPMVKSLLDDFKNKKRDRLVVCRDIKGKKILVKYLAVYDEAGTYMGTLETVEDISQY
ncbi:DUF438 domain-containing protein [Peptoniphilus sp. DNF00840]|uniref:DUF438 domain-containing protein n=1 Tax=Peptoniphilus sp. DNF00840 TaxID=1477000 RepID=UPI000784B649|nr:DUF438 domain-containing protein [Peptoniphilus sp. DNF00840]KXB69129.1 hemerythrin HHE cation binding domain protein [Peptoniphilus sp. DNF00840]